MLVDQAKEANEKPFVYDHQHGGVDVLANPEFAPLLRDVLRSMLELGSITILF